MCKIVRALRKVNLDSVLTADHWPTSVAGGWISGYLSVAGGGLTCDVHAPIPVQGQSAGPVKPAAP